MPCYAISSFDAHWQMKSKLQLAKETVETFVTFCEMENYLQTVKVYEEVAVWHSAGTDIHHLVLTLM